MAASHRQHFSQAALVREAEARGREGALAEIAEERAKVPLELWEKARTLSRRDMEVELEQRVKTLEIELNAKAALVNEARLAAELKAEAAEQVIAHVRCHARAEGHEDAWKEAHAVAKREMQAEMKRLCVEQALSAQAELEQARQHICAELQEAEMAMAIAVRDAKEEAVAEVWASAHDVARDDAAVAAAAARSSVYLLRQNLSQGSSTSIADTSDSAAPVVLLTTGAAQAAISDVPTVPTAPLVDLAQLRERARFTEVEQAVMQRQELGTAVVTREIGAELKRAKMALLSVKDGAYHEQMNTGNVPNGTQQRERSPTPCNVNTSPSRASYGESLSYSEPLNSIDSPPLMDAQRHALLDEVRALACSACDSFFCPPAACTHAHVPISCTSCLYHPMRCRAFCTACQGSREVDAEG